MVTTAKDLTIFVGHSGSGKTEIALNWAWQLADSFPAVALVDLDILNPYFTSRQLAEPLQKKGIEVVAAPRGLANTDLPAISPRVRGLIKGQEYRVVCDVGGDDLGAIALGQFAADIKKQEYDLFLVVNPLRPLTSGYRDIIAMAGEIEAAAGLKVTALVSNPNLGGETNAAILQKGHRIVEEAASILELPIGFIALRADLAGEVKTFFNVPLFPLRIFLRKPWEQ
jgi:pimeloyl-ACP methyl ester carboxylesterase